MRIKNSFTFQVAAPVDVVSAAIIEIAATGPRDVGRGQSASLSHEFYIGASIGPRRRPMPYDGVEVTEESPRVLVGRRVTPGLNTESRYTLIHTAAGTRVRLRRTGRTIGVRSAVKYILCRPLLWSMRGTMNKGWSEEVQRRAGAIQVQAAFERAHRQHTAAPRLA